MERQASVEQQVMMEYRIGVLEGIVEWMLSNGVFVQSLEEEVSSAIHEKALELVKRRYPDVEVEFHGKWQR